MSSPSMTAVAPIAWKHHLAKLEFQATADIERLYSMWRTQGAAANTIESRRIALSSAFTQAVRHKRIPANPVQEAQAPAHHVAPVDERRQPT
ncbi:hypothetical protein LHJ74_00855 [Streptomyces sp. N2-109]|uniref:Integrase n=1 Tax=Streptomyces gossypii TaxID=2883101 RepID=A0ABT2JLB4_9ACTN|nr:hypothetical protein [Streptomyces gossypii]MCT2588506.1 hypothetical protein [Streptomyces gossypii]